MRLADRRRAAVWAIGAVVLLLTAPAMRTFLSRQMLYPAPSFPVPAPPAPLEEVRLPVGDGTEAIGWAWDAQPDSPSEAAALLVLHGNGENLGTLLHSGLFELLRDLDVSFLALDYPGYGRSTGRPSERANTDAAEAGLTWLRDRWPERRRVVWGWSLGAAVGAQAATRDPELSGIVLLSPWSTLDDVARSHFPGWLVRLLRAESYDTVAVAATLSCPALVMHGAADRIIPATQGEAVADAFPNLHAWRALRGSGHNDLLGRPEIWQATEEFLRTLPSRP